LGNAARGPPPSDGAGAGATAAAANLCDQSAPPLAAWPRSSILYPVHVSRGMATYVPSIDDTIILLYVERITIYLKVLLVSM
jgi:hypothetical protein